MKELELIKNHFTPVQPTVKMENGKVTYQEIRPAKDVALSNFVYCFWQLKTQRQLDRPFVYRVVSDGCIDIFFNHKRPTENFVMGFCRKATEFSIGQTFDYIGIRFFPTAFPILYGTNAKTLSNQSQELKLVLPELSNWITTHIAPLHSLEKVIEQLTLKLTQHVEKGGFKHDQRFLNALNLIFRRKGYLDTEKELSTGLSPRQLRRVFNFYIGTTAKTFSNVVRFQHILNAKPSKLSLKENKLYLDVGFFDQAHFIKNFKTFYGVTPSEAFH